MLLHWTVRSIRNQLSSTSSVYLLHTILFWKVDRYAVAYLPVYSWSSDLLKPPGYPRMEKTDGKTTSQSNDFSTWF